MEKVLRSSLAGIDEEKKEPDHKRKAEIDDGAGQDAHKKQRTSINPSGSFQQPSQGDRRDAASSHNGHGLHLPYGAEGDVAEIGAVRKLEPPANDIMTRNGFAIASQDTTATTAETEVTTAAPAMDVNCTKTAETAQDVYDKIRAYAQKILECSDLQKESIKEQADRIRSLELFGSPGLAAEKREKDRLVQEKLLLHQQLEHLQESSKHTVESITEMGGKIKSLEKQNEDMGASQQILKSVLQHVSGPVLGLDIDKCIELIRDGEPHQQAVILASAAYSSFTKKE
ncbi:hypothetical protein A1O1_06759 [Capronia coronata CBS 617.96]|uniref:Uncharacterized protein n=1 Tax=Capronia coronata CBS 617.96 TaxID=1182541 RepID=W9Y0I1_9EURO|nr:uncharacterized protein A1O1_06759 [Capronia coronata CBS 617.96]EXJ83140.1 hypothetical protein A1O1_06759 [Capronia coronata CBS 617.96]